MKQGQHSLFLLLLNFFLFSDYRMRTQNASGAKCRVFTACGGRAGQTIVEVAWIKGAPASSVVNRMIKGFCLGYWIDSPLRKEHKLFLISE